jgi:hypothetical protein
MDGKSLFKHLYEKGDQRQSRLELEIGEHCSEQTGIGTEKPHRGPRPGRVPAC